jgi:hypothetical protein
MMVYGVEESLDVSFKESGYSLSASYGFKG